MDMIFIVLNPARVLMLFAHHIFTLIIKVLL